MVPGVVEHRCAAVKLGLNAFNFEWDGHVRAMTGKREYWSGTAPRRLDVPAFTLR